MRLAVLLFVWGLFVASPITAQSLRAVAPGVTVLTVSDQVSSTVQNMGWLEFADHLLVVDPPPGTDWKDLAVLLSETSDRPIKHLAFTFGSSARIEPLPDGVTQLAITGQNAATVSEDLIAFPSKAVLSAGSHRVELIPHAQIGPERGLSLYVPDGRVLFAGDLIGNGRGSPPLRINDWIRSLLALERLNPSVVVPGSGIVGDADLLRNTRMALVELEATIASAVANGHSRNRALGAVASEIAALLPEGTVGYAYDDYVGILPADWFVNSLGLRDGPTPTAETPGWTPPAKVVVADLWPGRTSQLALVAPNVEIVVATDQEHAVREVHDADAILGWLTPEILESAKRLRWVALYSAGVERYLAMPGFAESDVVLTNGQRLYAAGGAEHVIGTVLALARRFPTAMALQRERRWDNTPLTGATPVSGAGSELVELRGRTMLVAGLGGIGTEVARLAHGIGMRVIATRASRREGPPFVEYVGLSNELMALTAEADVIVNCLPLTAQTENTFSEEFFETTKSTAYFVNIGRGKTVDTEALTRALKDGRIAGAGLDVTEPEPLPAGHELWGMTNVIVTPHVGGDSDAHMERIWLLFRENLRRFAAGEALLSVVDKSRGYGLI